MYSRWKTDLRLQSCFVCCVPSLTKHHVMWAPLTRAPFLSFQWRWTLNPEHKIFLHGFLIYPLQISRISPSPKYLNYTNKPFPKALPLVSFSPPPSSMLVCHYLNFLRVSSEVLRIYNLKGNLPFLTSICVWVTCEKKSKARGQKKTGKHMPQISFIWDETEGWAVSGPHWASARIIPPQGSYLHLQLPSLCYSA